MHPVHYIFITYNNFFLIKNHDSTLSIQIKKRMKIMTANFPIKY